MSEWLSKHPDYIETTKKSKSPAIKSSKKSSKEEINDAKPSKSVIKSAQKSPEK